MTIIIIKGLEYTKQVMHNATAHHSLTDAQLVPEQRSPFPGQLPPVYTLDMTSHGMEYPFGQFGSASLAVFPPNFLCPRALLAGHEKLKNPWLQSKHYLATTGNTSVLSACFSYQTQNMALYQLLGRQLTLSQLKPRHIALHWSHDTKLDGRFFWFRPSNFLMFLVIFFPEHSSLSLHYT